MVSPSRTWQLRRAIQEISRHELSRERVYTYAGWTKVDERRVYLTTPGALGAEGLDPDVRVDLGQNNMRYYELPVIQQLGSLSRTFINEGMRAGIRDPITRARTITLYLDKEAFRSALGFPDEETIYLLLIDRQGTILWRA